MFSTEIHYEVITFSIGDTKAGTKTKLNSVADIVGFSIIIAGEPSGEGHAKSVTVRLPE